MLEVVVGFKQSTNNLVYILPNGKVSKFAKYKETYKYKVTKLTYIDENDARNRVYVKQLEVLDPDLKHSNFENYDLVYHFSLPKGDPTKVPDVTKQCIRTVEPLEDLKETLDQFAKTAGRFILITKKNATLKTLK